MSLLYEHVTETDEKLITKRTATIGQNNLAKAASNPLPLTEGDGDPLSTTMFLEF